MTHRIYIAFITLLLLSSTEITSAQYYPDGSRPTSEYITMLNANLEQENSTFFDTTYNNLNVDLGINFHIVKDDTGQVNYSIALLDECISILNEYFSPIGIAFNTNNVNIINEWEYSYNRNINDDKELFKKYAAPNEINVFLVELIERGEVPFYGYTYFPSDSSKTSIVIQKSSMSGKNLTTQMGHFMGLLSTHEVFGGAGTVEDTVNCQRNGDFICDTYADPGLYNAVNSICLYEGAAVDPNGRLYIPSVANLMSDSPEDCRCLFTMDQFRRMYFYYNKYRHRLLSK